MEVLGFIETPATTVDSRLTWVETTEQSPITTPITEDPLQGWVPNEISAESLGKSVRWGLVSVLAAVLILAAIAAVWVYRRPAVETAQARGAVVAAVESLLPEIDRLRQANRSLDAGEISGTAVNLAVLGLDAGVREVFETAAALHPTDLEARTSLIAASGDVADAVRRFSDAYSIRSAVIPALTPPELLTDPSLVELEDAAAAFADWQARYESIRADLPDTVFRSVVDAMAALSANLSGHQRLYLDAMSDGDAETAAAVISRIDVELGNIEERLFEELGNVKAQVEDSLDAADDVFRDVLSLLR